MKETSRGFIVTLGERYPALKPQLEVITQATQALIDAYRQGNKLLICGNGGSAADSEHIVGELMKGFIQPRPVNEKLAEKIRKTSDNADYLIHALQYGLPAISLVSEVGLSTAFANDCAPDVCFAQEVLGYGKPGDILLGISTSGNSKNVVYAAQIAKAIGVKVIGLTGEKESKLSAIADIVIKAPSHETFKIQEYHLPIYHAICLATENEFFGK
jgi:D-sedoheptulose 7-phosphate isomerase